MNSTSLRLATTVALGLLLAGCAGPRASDADTPSAGAPSVEAPSVTLDDGTLDDATPTTVAANEGTTDDAVDDAASVVGTWAFDPATSFQASKPSLIESLGPEFLELTAPEQAGIVGQMSQVLDGMTISIALLADGSVTSSFEQMMFGERMSDEAVGEWTLIDGEVHITTRPADMSGFEPGAAIPDETQVATLVGDTLTTVVDGGGMEMTMVFRRQ